MATVVRCWWCGIEPGTVHEITTMSDREPQYLANWPRDGDHVHGERQPSPAQMEQAGHEVLMRIRSAAA